MQATLCVTTELYLFIFELILKSGDLGFHRSIVQLVECRSPKPKVGGSSPSASAKSIKKNIKIIASGDARCVRHSVTVFNQVGSNPIGAARCKFI